MKRNSFRFLGRGILVGVVWMLGAACGGSKGRGNDAGPTDMAACMPTSSRKFYINTVTLPMNKNQFAMDLNGDGKPDNQLGNIINILNTQGTMPQAAVDNALANGSVVMLVTESSNDPTFTTDPCARTTLNSGQNRPPDGGTSYSIDTSIMAGQFSGAIDTFSFSSTPPTMPPDVQMTLPLPILPGQVIKIPLHGSHVQYDAVGTALTMGQVNGGVTKTDIDLVVIPGLAAGFELQVQVAPTSPQSMQLLQLFDVGNGAGGNCTNPDGTLGKPRDGHIAVCEVAGNSLIQVLLAPDVQLFQNGVFNPNPANTMKDSLSVGVAFTGVPAMF